MIPAARRTFYYVYIIVISQVTLFSPMLKIVKKKLVFVANFKKSLSLNYYRIRAFLRAQEQYMGGEDNGKFFFL